MYRDQPLPPQVTSPNINFTTYLDAIPATALAITVAVGLFLIVFSVAARTLFQRHPRRETGDAETNAAPNNWRTQLTTCTLYIGLAVTVIAATLLILQALIRI